MTTLLLKCMYFSVIVLSRANVNVVFIMLRALGKIPSVRNDVLGKVKVNKLLVSFLISQFWLCLSVCFPCEI